MTRWLRQWRTLLSREAVLVILVLAVGVAVLYQAQKTGGLRTQRAAVEAKLVKDQESLTALLASQDPAALRQQIQELQASPNSQTLPARREALGLSAALADYAAQSGLQIVALSTAEDTIPGTTQGGTVLAVKVTLELEGPIAKLIGLLSTVNGYPTATVQSLGFSAGQNGAWHAKLEVAVAYRPPGQGKE